MRAGSPWNCTRCSASVSSVAGWRPPGRAPGRPVGLEDVLRLAGQRHPAERALALAEERADVGGHEAGVVEGVSTPAFLCLGAHVVAVVEDGPCRGCRKSSIASTCRAMRGARRAVSGGVALAQRRGLVKREPGGNVAVQRIVGGGLVGDQVRAAAAPHELRQHLGGVSDERDATAPRRARQRGDTARGHRPGRREHVEVALSPCRRSARADPPRRRGRRPVHRRPPAAARRPCRRGRR